MVLGDCAGLQCQLGAVDGMASFLIQDKCQDPIESDLSIAVTWNGVNVTFEGTIGVSLIMDAPGNISIVVDVSRDDNYLSVQVSPTRSI